MVAVLVSSGGNSNFKIGAINTSRSSEYLAYLLKYDTVHGKFQGIVDFNEDTLIVNDQKVNLLFISSSLSTNSE